jgi:hypothetical protein
MATALLLPGYGVIVDDGSGAARLLPGYGVVWVPGELLVEDPHYVAVRGRSSFEASASGRSFVATASGDSFEASH